MHGVGGRAAEAVDVEHFAVCSATVCDDVSLVSARVVVAIAEHKSAPFFHSLSSVLCGPGNFSERARQQGPFF